MMMTLKQRLIYYKVLAKSQLLGVSFTTKILTPKKYLEFNTETGRKFCSASGSFLEERR